jgi:hypothetical protein
MSRQALAEAVNAHVFATTKRVTGLDANYVGKLERGEIRWPSAEYRQAFRAVLGVSTDADLGFYVIRRTVDDAYPGTDEDLAVLGYGEPVAHRVAPDVGPAVRAPDVPAVQVIVIPGAAMTLVRPKADGSGLAIVAGPVQVIVDASATGAADVIAPVGVSGQSAVATTGARVYSLGDRRRVAASRRVGQTARPGSIA